MQATRSKPAEAQVAPAQAREPQAVDADDDADRPPHPADLVAGAGAPRGADAAPGPPPDGGTDADPLAAVKEVFPGRLLAFAPSDDADDTDAEAGGEAAAFAEATLDGQSEGDADREA